MNLTQGDRLVTKYEAEFLRLSQYARRLVANDYEKSVCFEEGLRYDIKVLIALQREWVFIALVDKEKITREFKRTEREKRDREKSQNEKKRKELAARVEPIARAGPIARAEQVPICGYCSRRHMGECWRRTRACFRCGVVGHKISECLLMVEPRRAPV
ncbi:Zinc finger CCHC domain-containing 8 [Gossypium australe]|uniref:Zinc finger CCHC domain-containing 8 n=1 Tax=Gossypium australe TaxID=47621 RepID=A0A5B6WFS0_9ROSI|nr:Zinc finger CCHC domain-containing 8 [Gossypium australe]